MKYRTMPVAGILVAVLSGTIFAATRADSLLAFTGATRAKFAMRTFPWCTADYVPRSSYGQNIVGYDTKTDKTWVILGEQPSATGCAYARIDRSGKWVAYSNLGDKCIYVRSMDDTTIAARKIVDGASFAGWWVAAFQYDVSTKTEYLYTLNCDAASWGGTDNNVYKIPFSFDNGTVDLTKSTKITLPGSNTLDNSLALSQDGTKIGCAYPWPNTFIYDMTGKQLYAKHNGQFGCQANIAPDNSYYFFHCRDDHGGVNMFTGALADQTFTAVDFRTNLVGGLPAGQSMTFRDPRWSNHPRFVSNVYPMDEGGYLEDPYSGQLGGTADWVKNQLVPCRKPSSVLEKFTADFKSIESSIYVAFDRRRFDLNLESWLDNGVTTGVTAIVAGHENAAALSADAIRVVQADGRVSVLAPSDRRLVVRMTDARGKIVAQGAGVDNASIDARGIGAGLYFVSIAGSTGHAVRPVTVGR